MVWGSTLEEDKVYVGRAEPGRNEVGVQLCSPAKENMTSPECLKSVPSAKLRANQRRVLEGCENRQRRNPLLFRN